jgi:hypothetical protein
MRDLEAAGERDGHEARGRVLGELLRGPLRVRVPLRHALRTNPAVRPAPPRCARGLNTAAYWRACARLLHGLHRRIPLRLRPRRTCVSIWRACARLLAGLRPLRA